MNTNLTEASVLVSIDRDVQDNSSFSPAQYEIIRQVIYHTGDLEYASLLKFVNQPLLEGYQGLISGRPIIVDVPEIQVSIVPKLQPSFSNGVYCCSTTGKKSASSNTKAAVGLKDLANLHNKGIFIIGQEITALATLLDLVKDRTVNPSLAIATTPSFIEPDLKEYFKTATFPIIYIDSSKGGATVGSAIFNALVSLAERVKR